MLITPIIDIICLYLDQNDNDYDYISRSNFIPKIYEQYASKISVDDIFQNNVIPKIWLANSQFIDLALNAKYYNIRTLCNVFDLIDDESRQYYACKIISSSKSNGKYFVWDIKLNEKLLLTILDVLQTVPYGREIFDYLMENKSINTELLNIIIEYKPFRLDIISTYLKIILDLPNVNLKLLHVDMIVDVVSSGLYSMSKNMDAEFWILTSILKNVPLEFFMDNRESWESLDDKNFCHTITNLLSTRNLDELMMGEFIHKYVYMIEDWKLVCNNDMKKVTKFIESIKNNVISNNDDGLWLDILVHHFDYDFYIRNYHLYERVGIKRYWEEILYMDCIEVKDAIKHSNFLRIFQHSGKHTIYSMDRTTIGHFLFRGIIPLNLIIDDLNRMYRIDYILPEMFKRVESGIIKCTIPILIEFLMNKLEEYQNNREYQKCETVLANIIEHGSVNESFFKDTRMKEILTFNISNVLKRCTKILLNAQFIMDNFRHLIDEYSIVVLCASDTVTIEMIEKYKDTFTNHQWSTLAKNSAIPREYFMINLRSILSSSNFK